MPDIVFLPVISDSGGTDWFKWIQLIVSLIAACASVMAPILAFAAAMLAVYLTNRSNEKQQRTDREQDIKRNVYLDGAEALHGMRGYLISLANPLTSEEEIKAFSVGVGKAIMKAYVIAPNALLDKLMVLERNFFEGTSAIESLRVKLVEENKEFERIHEAITKKAGRVADIEDALQLEESRLEADRDDGHITVLRMERDSCVSLLDLWRPMRERHEQSLIENRKKLDQNFVSTLNTFDSDSSEINCLVRKELGFDFDEVAYKNSVKKENARLEEKLEEIYPDLAKETPSEDLKRDSQSST